MVIHRQLRHATMRHRPMRLHPPPSCAPPSRFVRLIRWIIGCNSNEPTCFEFQLQSQIDYLLEQAEFTDDSLYILRTRLNRLVSELKIEEEEEKETEQPAT